MYDISDLLRELLDRYSNTSQLDGEFRRMLRDVTSMVTSLRPAFAIILTRLSSRKTHSGIVITSLETISEELRIKKVILMASLKQR